MMNILKLPMLLGSLLVSQAIAELTVANIFTDHAVLQRESAIPVWGTADEGATIKVSFAGQEKSAQADKSGKWQVELDALEASFEGRVLTVASGEERADFKEVQVGDVWICSGQSNMQMRLNAVPKAKKLTSEAKHIRSFTMPQAVAFEEQDSHGGEWLAEVPDSAVAFTFAHYLQLRSEAPVGIILTSWGSSGLEAWMPRDMMESVPHFKEMMETFDANENIRNKIQVILDGPRPWGKGDDIFLRRQTNILYNAMMHPLIPYACKGLVWYQGERNAKMMGSMEGKLFHEKNSGMLKYGETLKHWVARYRRAWGNDEMQFQVVMLPGYAKGLDGKEEHPNAISWAWMRESQLQALDLPHTSVVNTIDLGSVMDIHPKDKIPIGQRLALLAARDTLKQELVAEGPVMQEVVATAGRLTVKFDQNLKTTNGEAPSAFWVADDSQEWVPALAEIQGESIVLLSSEVKDPLYVRYAFAGKPQVNLVNEEGLPTRPFRTDSFPPSPQ